MIDITHKQYTLRTATALAVVKVSRSETIELVRNLKVPKGNVLEVSRTAGLFAVKRTSDMIPDCHPIPIESTKIWFEINDLSISVYVEVSAIYRTGVEVEAMHGTSVCALTIYDMLKPVDKEIEISSIKLMTKKGGKSDLNSLKSLKVSASIIVCSDRISAGKAEDKSGKEIQATLESFGIKVSSYIVIEDNPTKLKDEILKSVKKGERLILVSGGTGLSERDITAQTVESIIEKPIPGIMEAARNFGQQRTPYAMLSRSSAGIYGDSLLLTFPGSLKATREYLSAIFPYVLHVFDLTHQPPE